jgi:hypothetical protein
MFTESFMLKSRLSTTLLCLCAGIALDACRLFHAALKPGMQQK